MKLPMKAILPLLAAISTLATTGCAPYNAPLIEDISPSQTGFLVPLDGETSKQAKFNSNKFLKDGQIAEKRITIPRRWVKTGRWWWEGRYIDTMRLILVERKPVTREWTEEKESGTSSKNESITAESKESISITARMNCVAQIDEADAAKYLHRYNEKPLEEVMDTEIRAEIETRFAEECSKLYLRDEKNGILANKQAIMQRIRREVISYFKNRGVSITVLGLKGEFTYAKPIQDAINKLFVSIQEKKSAANYAFATKTLGATGVQFQLKSREQELQAMALENQKKAIDGWISGDVKMPLSVGGGTIFSLPIDSMAIKK